MKKTVFVIAIAAIITAGIFFYFLGKKMPTSFEEKRKVAHSIYFEGERKEAIPVLEKLADEAPSKTEEARIKMMLAFAYLEVQDGLKKSTNLLKEVGADPSYPALLRAIAIEDMGDLWMLGARKNDALASNIFSGEPYASFPDSSPPFTTKHAQLLSGANRIYEYASSFYALPISEYRIAEWNVKLAFRSSKAKSIKLPNQTSNYLKVAKDHLSKGNEAFSGASKLGYSGTDSGYAYWVKGVTLGMLSEVENSEKFKNEAEEAFRDSIVILKQSDYRNAAYTKSHILWASFSYASFLERAYGEDREQEIQDLLVNVTDSSASAKTHSGKYKFGFMRYLERIGKSQSAGLGFIKYDRDSATRLAKIDPKFAELLKQLGWKI